MNRNSIGDLKRHYCRVIVVIIFINLIVPAVIKYRFIESSYIAIHHQ